MGSTRNGTFLSPRKLDGLVESVERAGLVGDRDDLDAPVGGSIAVGRVDAQDQLGPRLDRVRDLGRIEAVDRDAEATVPEHLDRIADLAPACSRVATQVDQIGAFLAESVGLGDEGVSGKLRRVIDLGQDLKVIRAVISGAVVGLAEMPWQVAKILGAKLDRNAAGLVENRGQVAAAVSREDHPIDAGPNLEMAADPPGRHQCGHGDGKNGKLEQETRAGGKVFEHLPECELGQAAGDEEDAGRGWWRRHG